jgi:hypothetical protein
VSSLNHEYVLGTANSIDLPRRTPPPEPSLVTGAAQGLEFESLHAAPSTLRDLSILAVDDDVTTLELIEMVFEAHGARVTSVTTAEEALATLRTTPLDESYELLLSDIGLPGMDGYELVQRGARRTADHGAADAGDRGHGLCARGGSRDGAAIGIPGAPAEAL